MGERYDDESIDAELADELFFLSHGEDLLGNPIGRDDAQGMGVKSDHCRGEAELARALHHTSYDGLMAHVHPIEISDGRDTPLGKVSLSERVVDYEHEYEAQAVRGAAGALVGDGLAK